jgi:excisionase family DNA binding protein
MLQSSTSAAAVARNKKPPRYRASRASRAPRRVEAADEPVGGNVVLVTLDEAARMLGISRMTLFKLVVAGELRVRRFGRAVRVPISEVKRLGEPGVTAIKYKPAAMR